LGKDKYILGVKFPFKQEGMQEVIYCVALVYTSKTRTHGRQTESFAYNKQSFFLPFLFDLMSVNKHTWRFNISINIAGVDFD